MTLPDEPALGAARTPPSTRDAVRLVVALLGLVVLMLLLMAANHTVGGCGGG